MKITRVVTEEYEWPRPQALRDGRQVYDTYGLYLLRIDTDAGLTGYGLCTPPRQVARTIVQSFAPMLIGEDPIDVERLWHRMWEPKVVGRRGQTTRAISAIDTALWDIRAKAANMPLYKMLGAYRDRVPTYIAGGYYAAGKGLKELAQEMEENVAMGARAVKMKIGAVSIREDAERVKTVRKAIGPDVKLMVDANCAYRYYEAIQIAKRMEEYDVYWFEEPVMPDDYDGFAKLAAATTIPIAAGENEYTLYGFRDLVQHGGVPIFNADAKETGGISEWMKIAALARAFHLDMAPHGPQEIHVHLVAAISNGLIVEYYRDSFNPMWGKIYKHTVRLNSEGSLTPPDIPGIGMEPNYEALEPYRVA